MRNLLERARLQTGWLPNWAIGILVLVGALVIGVIIHRALYIILKRLAARRDLFWRSLVSRTERPARFAIVVAALAIGATIAPLTIRLTAIINHVLLICFILLVAWMIRTAMHIWTTVYLRRFKLDSEDNLLARKHVTQSHILLRIGDTLIVVIALAAALMTFNAVRQYGVSLLASAGAAGIVVGLALQPVLKNLFAGIQLAVTQPIRIDDGLLVEGEFGNVEEITSTYVVIKLWDWRRMILPLSYFIEKPFQNWTRDDAALIGSILIYLDYSVPIAALRAEAERIAKSSPLWDTKVINVSVNDFREATMEVRILVSASSGGRVSDLKSEMREQLIGFIQREYPSALPRFRAEMGGGAAAGALSSGKEPERHLAAVEKNSEDVAGGPGEGKRDAMALQARQIGRKS